MSATRTGRSVGPSSLWDEQHDPEDPQPLKASWDPVGEPRRQSTRTRPTRTGRRRSAFGWFVHHYGWRAYAIPVLMALTVVVVIQIAREGSSAAGSDAANSAPVVATTEPASADEQAPPVQSSPADDPEAGAEPSQELPSAPASESSALGPDPNGTYAASLTAGALPDGPALVEKGSGTWRVVPGTSAPIGNGPEVLTYSVEVEDGLQDPALDQEFAAKVDGTLADPRSWIASGKYTLQRIDSGVPDFRVSATSQLTTRDVCGWSIQLESSCYFRGDSRVIINDARWNRGAVSYHGDLGSYRTYAINHEVGHALGYQHQPCGENGGLAPVMMQQSWSTSNDELAALDPQTIPADGFVCNYNPYPYPRGTQSEQPTT